MAAVTLDRVTKIYPNGFQAVTDLSLELVDGEFLVLVGPLGLRQVDRPADDRRAGRHQ